MTIALGALPGDGERLPGRSAGGARTIDRVRIVVPRSTEEFLERAGPVLLADEARHNLALGILSTVVAHPEVYPEQHYWIVEAEDVVVGAALQTPPYNLILPRPLDDAALPVLARGIDEDLPGVTAALPEADAFASAWCEERRLRPQVRVAQGIYALEHVVPVTGVPGAMRPALVSDRDLARAWFQAFADEVLEAGGPTDADAEARQNRSIDARLGGGPTSGIALWADGGEVVSLAGFGGDTPHGTRIGPVYTPPARRGCGYASALTAELSAQLLVGGRRFCFLYTDLANPTSNRIYQAIGYVRVCDSVELTFEPAGA